MDKQEALAQIAKILPAGYAVVPVEPTLNMIAAYKAGAKGAVGRWCLKGWNALISARPPLTLP